MDWFLHSSLRSSVVYALASSFLPSAFPTSCHPLRYSLRHPLRRAPRGEGEGVRMTVRGAGEEVEKRRGTMNGRMM